jgi:hypothetical protein
MSTTILRVHTHWNTEEAYSLLELLDTLRDEILEQHGEDIARMLQEDAACSDEWQLELPFTDLPPF